MIKTAYLRELDNDGTEIFGEYKVIALKNRAVVVFDEEGMFIHRLKPGTDDMDFTDILVYAHLYKIGEPCKEVEIEKISKMSAIEFFEYLVDLREARIKCSFR